MTSNPSNNVLQVVYVNYHAEDLLADSLRSLLSRSAEVPALDVTIVDNSCDDAAWSRLEGIARDRAQCLRMDDNIGFARGCNAGARAGTSHHLLFLNPDTIVPAGTLARLWQALESHERALIGPRQFADEGLQFAHAPLRGARLFDEAWDLWFARGWAPRRSERFVAERARLFARQGPVRLRCLSGGCLAVRRSVFDALGGWDERYWMYGEDVELCVRARRSGVEILYLPDVPIVHFIEGSTRHIPERAQASHQDGRRMFKRSRYGRLVSAIERGLTRATHALLPRRDDPWQRARTLEDTTFSAPFGNRPWAVELGRSPLFDNCLSAFPRTDNWVVPARLLEWLPPGEFFLRVAGEESRNRWRETGLFRLLVT